MANCIRCGKNCNDGETMCDECKVWFQQKTGGVVPSAKSQKEKKNNMMNGFSKKREKTEIKKDSIVQFNEKEEKHESTVSIREQKSINLNPKIFLIMIGVVIIVVLLIVIFSFAKKESTYTPASDAEYENEEDYIEDYIEQELDSDVDVDINNNVNVEEQILSIRGTYNDIVTSINNGEYTEKVSYNGISTYYDESEVKAIIIPRDLSGNQYSQSYYYDYNELIFAYYEAEDAHRFYFTDNRLIRWRYSKDAADAQNAENHDLEQSAEYNYWNSTVNEDSDSYLQFVLTSESLPEGDYILADSDTRYLDKNDLLGMSAEECRLARNELYARHGRKFDDESLQAYFNQKDWYIGYVNPDEFTEDMLNDYEIHNRDLIVEYEIEQGYR